MKKLHERTGRKFLKGEFFYLVFFLRLLIFFEVFQNLVFWFLQNSKITQRFSAYNMDCFNLKYVKHVSLRLLLQCPLAAGRQTVFYSSWKLTSTLMVTFEYRA